MSAFDRLSMCTAGHPCRYMGGYRITDREAMRVVIEAAGEARTKCEQSLSKVNSNWWPFSFPDLADVSFNPTYRDLSFL